MPPLRGPLTAWHGAPSDLTCRRYAYFKKLDYFSTECIYSPNAYRGFAREFLKDLEAVRPAAILGASRSRPCSVSRVSHHFHASRITDVIHSAEFFEVAKATKKPVLGALWVWRVCHRSLRPGMPPHRAVTFLTSMGRVRCTVVMCMQARASGVGTSRVTDCAKPASCWTGLPEGSRAWRWAASRPATWRCSAHRSETHQRVTMGLELEPRQMRRGLELELDSFKHLHLRARLPLVVVASLLALVPAVPVLARYDRSHMHA